MVSLFFIMSDFESIYSALSNAETGGEENPWIRTKVMPKDGSTAFGPVQITSGLVTDALARKKLSNESIKFATEVLLPMQINFAKYGGKDMVEGKEVYDYGQTGGFDSDTYAESYQRLANELINMKIAESSKNGVRDINAFLKKWRGKKPEKGYLQRFNKKFKRNHYKKD